MKNLSSYIGKRVTIGIRFAGTEAAYTGTLRRCDAEYGVELADGGSVICCVPLRVVTKCELA